MFSKSYRHTVDSTDIPYEYEGVAHVYYAIQDNIHPFHDNINMVTCYVCNMSLILPLIVYSATEWAQYVSIYMKISLCNMA